MVHSLHAFVMLARTYPVRVCVQHVHQIWVSSKNYPACFSNSTHADKQQITAELILEQLGQMLLVLCMLGVLQKVCEIEGRSVRTFLV